MKAVPRVIAGIGSLLVALAWLLPGGWVSAPTGPFAVTSVLLFRAAVTFLGVVIVLAGRWLGRTGTELRPGPGPARPRALWAIAALALGLRLINLDTDLWFDEAVTLTEFVRLPVRDLLTTYTTLNNHILYSLLAKAAVAVLGESAWALRLPAVAFGVAGLFALWRLALPLAGRREALGAVLLLAVSHHHVLFSQSARGYTALLAANLLSMALLLEALKRPARGRWLAWGVVNAAALWFHLTAAFAIGAQTLVALGVLFARRRGRAAPDGGRHSGAAGAGPFLGILLCAALALVIYSLLLPQMADAFGRQAGEASVNVKVREWTSPLWTLIEAAKSFAPGPAAALALAVAAALAAAGFVSYARREPAFAAVMVLPVPIALAILKLLSFHIWPRYFFPGMAFGILCLVRGMSLAAEALCRRGPLLRRGVRGETLAAAAVVLVAAISIVPLASVLRLPKQDYRGAAAWVAAERGPAEPVLTAGLASLPFKRLYAPEWTAIDQVAELDAALARGGRVWLVYSFPAVLSTASPEILDRARETFIPAREFPGTIGDGTIHVLRSR